MQDFFDESERLMADHRACTGSGLVAAVAIAGATAVAATGLALAGAGTASADGGKPIHHIVGDAAKTAEHAVADTGTNVQHAVGDTAANAKAVIGGLGADVRSFVSGLRGTPLGGALPTAATHPINSRSIAQIQSQQQAAANLSEIIQQSGIDNDNAVAAQEELQQEQEILIKANTLAQGIQNGTVSNTQEVQVIRYIAQAKALQAQAHARFRNNIN